MTDLFVTPAPSIPNVSRNSVASLDFLGEVTFPTGFTFNGTQVGGLSSITYDPFNKVYYSISDDRSQFNPARFYTVSINLSDGSLDNGDITFQNVTTLTDENGNPFPQLSLDPEGIALTSNGTLFISSEGERSTTRLINPFINEFSLQGKQINELPIPSRFEPAGTGQTEPGIRNNLAFESLTITPDQRFLFTATENALVQDGPAADLTHESPSRIVQYDLQTGQPIREFQYFTDPVAVAPAPSNSFSTNGLVELLALDNSGTLLSLERSFSTGVGNSIKLYEVSLRGLTDISGFDSVNGLDVDAVAQKRLLIDFADLGLTLDNVEGMSLGPRLPDGRQSLVLVSDNNFSDTQFTQFLSFALDLNTVPGVLPTVETPTVLDVDDPPNGVTRGDADDPAIYVNSTDASQSFVISSLKDGGLQVYDLNGQVLQTIAPDNIRYNNVDLVYGFQVGGQSVDLAIASDRKNDTLAIFQIDPTTRQLSNITANNIPASIFGVDDGEQTAYGLTTYRSPFSGESYVFVSQREGNQVAQLKLVDDGTGGVSAQLVRTISVPVPAGGELEDAQVEGMVADRELGYLYVAQENVGIWKFSAELSGSLTGTLVDQVAPNGSNLQADVEGLTIYYAENGTGYLLASSQGDSTFAVYSREGDNAYLGNFQVGDSNGIDSVENSDGADVINVPLGPEFPFGLMVTHDGSNDPTVVVNDDGELENVSTNFKFVPWENVANAFSTPLAIAPSGFDPRNPTLTTPPITGSEANDTLYGGNGNDTILSRGGNDQIFGGEGVNILFGGDGDDLIYGGSQSDQIDGGNGSDRIFAGEGNNTIFAGAGNDTIYTGSGNDQINGGTGNDTIWLGGGQDIVVLARGNGVDTINSFQLGQTQLGLAGGLTFSDLAIAQETNAILIEIAATGEDLARLSWVQASSISANSFVIV